MITGLIGKKMNQTQGFLEDGTRVPISTIWLGGNLISQIKSFDKDKYDAIQLGFGTKKKANKAEMGHAKKNNLKAAPKFLRELRLSDVIDIEKGTEIKPSEVFEEGDLVDVMGVSKGKGYAGVVKRYHFHGGPKTHGQSDRHRAPGAIGQGTTPGRVYKGKKMSGRMGNVNVTIKNLEILSIADDMILLKGLIPGVIGGVVVVKKAGKNKKFIPLYSEKTEEMVQEEAAEEKITKKNEEPQKEIQEEISKESQINGQEGTHEEQEASTQESKQETEEKVPTEAENQKETSEEEGKNNKEVKNA